VSEPLTPATSSNLKMTMCHRLYAFLIGSFINGAAAIEATQWMVLPKMIECSGRAEQPCLRGFGYAALLRLVNHPVTEGSTSTQILISKYSLTTSRYSVALPFPEPSNGKRTSEWTINIECARPARIIKAVVDCTQAIWDGPGNIRNPQGPQEYAKFFEFDIAQNIRKL
jgi:hypothetical protein